MSITLMVQRLHLYQRDLVVTVVGFALLDTECSVAALYWLEQPHP